MKITIIVEYQKERRILEEEIDDNTVVFSVLGFRQLVVSRIRWMAYKLETQL